jgi:ferredoxin
MEEPKYLPDKWSSLVKSLQQFESTQNDKIFQSSLWGDVRITSTCNGCGTCAKACPTAALDISEQDGLWSILFAASRCTQCGLCKDICVSKSIEILSTASLEIVLDQSPQVLIEKKQAEVDSLLESVEERMARILGCAIRN